MKIIHFALLIISAVSIFSSCKKEKVKSINSDSATNELVLLLKFPNWEAHGALSASLDGNYFGTELKETYYYTHNGGLNWQTATGTGLQTKNFSSDINKNGYKIWKEELSQGKTSLFNLKTGNTTDIQFFESTINSYKSNGFFLGNDDYVYVITAPRYYYKKIGTNKWDTLNIDVSNAYNNGIYAPYLGMNIETGGAVFIDDENQKLFVHNPTNNSIDTKRITYNTNSIYERLSGNDPATRYAYNGNDKIVAGNNLGVAIINIVSGQVSYVAWPEEFKNYDTPLALSIDADGTVFASAHSSVKLKISNGELSQIFTSSHIISKGGYSYFFTPSDLRQLSATDEKVFNTPFITQVRAEGINCISARVYNKKIYALQKLKVSNTALFMYDDEKNQYEYIPESIGEYDYIYSEGSNMYVLGRNSVFYSKDNGENWHTHTININPVRFRYVTKGASMYYATAVVLKANGDNSNTMTVLSSPDLLNWTHIGGIIKNDLQEVLRVVTPTGLGFCSVLSNGIFWKEETRDFGANWDVVPSNFMHFNAEHKGYIYNIYGSSAEPDITVEKRTENYELIEKRSIPNNGHNLWQADQIYFNESGDMFLINYEGFYTIRN